MTQFTASMLCRACSRAWMRVGRRKEGCPFCGSRSIVESSEVLDVISPRRRRGGWLFGGAAQ